MKVQHDPACSTLLLRPTSELTECERTQIRALLALVYGREFTEQDWQHTLGGWHVLGRVGDEIVAHVAVVERVLWYADTPLHTGYVEGLAVHPDQRRYGWARAVMQQAEEWIRAHTELGALSDGTGIPGFYQRLGWQPWFGPTWVRTCDGRQRTSADDDSIRVLRTEHTANLDRGTPLICEWREGDVW